MSAEAKPATAPSLDPAFRRRRVQNWMILGLLYSFFYMSRYNFAALMAPLAHHFGWTNTELGVFETMMPLVYGLSVVLNGPLADRIGGKKAFLVGAAGVVVMNTLFGLGTMFVLTPAVMSGTGHDAELLTPAVLRFGMSPGLVLALMATVWGVNGYFQSFGALSIVKVNAQWFHVRERGTFAGVFGVLIRFGLILAFSGAPLIATYLPLQWAFWIPAICVAVLFVLNLFFMENSPQDAGLGDFETGDASSGEGGGPASVGHVLRKVFANPTMWMIAVASMMIGMVRRSTVDSWYPKYFSETYMPDGGTLASFAPYQTAAWGIAGVGIIGGFAFGIASDRLFQSRRAPVIMFGFIGMAVLLVLFGLSDRMSMGPWAAATCLALLSFFVNGAHGMIGGAASMDFGGRKAAATAAGLFDGMQYLAAAPVGMGMGALLDRWGWSAWQWAPIPFAIAGAIIISRLWNAVPAKKRAH
jgi:OPA family glycerol-3-phosphate transporter-like MFS transporter